MNVPDVILALRANLIDEDTARDLFVALARRDNLFVITDRAPESESA